MKYVVFCDLIFGWVGEINEEGKYTVAISKEKAKQFPSIEDAQRAISELVPVWIPHLRIEEYTKSTQPYGQKAPPVVIDAD